jgi:hypothetical protein
MSQMSTKEGWDSMKAPTKYLDKLDLLVRTERRGMQPNFSAEMHDGIKQVYDCLPAVPPTGFQDAYCNVTEAVLNYERNPELAGFAQIWRALGAYRQEAISQLTAPGV